MPISTSPATGRTTTQRRTKAITHRASTIAFIFRTPAITLLIRYSALDRTQATRYYADIANTYNRLPLAFEKVNPDLTGYVVGKAVDALFDQIAREEANIRANPVARTTDLLRKVFGQAFN
jgi:hypothetical protein